ncbi:DNA polymerase III subunit beta [Mycoplasmopsis gallinacea]|uniref:DNA polymerase III, beta subunit n=1 Tax=Mycoplasmopsis gallinacea TaxID=29556 RepID=A0A449A368_9BACT|nr:DNA polymerase III subunit beta [Mycoplasmopsis gallinacea]VEU58696.1 DNA polymerase III, beta subunit [Mycoplasmopsis gallinacea]
MKFTIKKNIIENTVDFLNNYVDSNDASVLNRCLFFEINSEALNISSNNPAVSAKKTIFVDESNLKLDSSGKVFINANIFRNIIKKFENEVTINVNNNIIDIYEGKTKFTIAKLDNENQMQLVDFNEPSNKIEISSKKLENVINEALVSTNSSVDKINNLIYKVINIKSNNDKLLTMVSTDGFRLSKAEIEIDSQVEIDINVDSKILKKLVTKDAPKKVNLFFKDYKLGISYENTIIQANLVDLKYLDISNVFERNYSKEIIIDKQELLNLINKTIFYVSDKIKRLSFNISKEKIKTSYEVPEIGYADAETTNFEYKGEEFDIDVNYNFIEDAVSILDNGKIKIQISDKEDQLLFTSLENDKNKQLITPMRRY